MASSSAEKKKASFAKLATNIKCAACQKTVYPLEKVTVAEKQLHDTCFKCSICKTRLTVGSYKLLNGLFYCEPHYGATLARVGGDFTQFSTDTPEGPFFDVLVEDALVEILTWLTDAEAVAMQQVSKRFAPSVKKAQLKFPTKPKLEVERTGHTYWPNLEEVYTYNCNFSYRELGENKSRLDGFILRITPSKLADTPTLWRIPYTPNITSAKVNLQPFAHYDYELPVRLELLACRGHSASVSKPVTVTLRSVSDASGTRHISGGCFTESTLVTIADGSKRRAGEVQEGDLVLGGDLRAHKVVLVKRFVPDTVKKMVEVDGVWLTRGHPILRSDTWVRPDELKPFESVKLQEALVNFLLTGDDKTILLSSPIDSTPIRASALGCDCGSRLAQLNSHNDAEFHLAYELCA